VENIYKPKIAVIKDIVKETEDIKTFTLQFRSDEEQRSFSFLPGQFVEVSVFGYGEIPIGLSSDPSDNDAFEITVKAVGYVSGALHEKKVDDQIGIRGPLGNYFPIEEIKGKDIIVIGGGIGLPPLRSLIFALINRREEFNRLTVLYGARTPVEQIYKKFLSALNERKDMEYLETVDTGDENWNGKTGVVTTLIPEIQIDPANSYAFICGPPVMIKYVIAELKKTGLDDKRIISTLERNMKCGVGKCGHCAIGNKYVCVDGPVFSYEEMKRLIKR